MGSRRLELTIVGAENLPDIRRLGRMKVYAVVSIDGCTGATNTDKDGETNPTWDFPFVYNISEAHLRQAGLDAVVDLYCETTLAGGKLVGRVVKTLFDKGIKSQSCLSFPIAGTVSGRLYIRYCFEEKDLPLKRNQVWAKLITQERFYFSQDYYNY